MKILAVCIGQARKLPGKNTKTGIAKAAVTGPVMVDAEGLVGDAIINRKHHGGPNRRSTSRVRKHLPGGRRSLGARWSPAPSAKTS